MKALRFRVFQDGDFREELHLDHEVIKIGKLRSSHLHLDGDGVARMHAVIERTTTGVFRLIDLGSFKGSELNGTKIDKNTELPPEGTMRFGSFEVKYEIVDVQPKEELEEPVPSKTLEDVINNINNRVEKLSRSEEDKEHHRELLKSLLAELQRVDPEAAKSAAKIEAMWSFHEDKRKREWLRLVIRGIREGREMDKLFHRKRVATMMNLGLEGIEEVFTMSPEEALSAAHETLLDMAMSKQALAMLDSMGFLKAMQNGIEQLPAAQHAEATKEYEMVAGVHAKLVDRFQNTIVAGTSLLPLYMSRAGGREVTEADRAQWKAAFEQIKKASEAN